MKGIRVQLICVGKMKEKFYIDAAAEYVKRLSAYCKLQVVELPEERLPSNPSQARIDAALEKEAAAIRAKLAPGASLVALCVEGRMRSSEELSGLLSDWSSRGGSSLSFLIGGSYGLGPLPQGPGVGQAVHVPHDLSPPSGPGDAAGAALPGLLQSAGNIKYHKLREERLSGERAGRALFVARRRTGGGERPRHREGGPGRGASPRGPLFSIVQGNAGRKRPVVPGRGVPVPEQAGAGGAGPPPPARRKSRMAGGVRVRRRGRLRRTHAPTVQPRQTPSPH